MDIDAGYLYNAVGNNTSSDMPVRVVTEDGTEYTDLELQFDFTVQEPVMRIIAKKS